MANGVVEAPGVEPARFGLLSVAEVVNHGPGDEHWISTARWQNAICSFDINLIDVCNPGAPTVITTGANAGESEATGFGIDVTDTCTTTFGYNFEERKMRLQAATENVTQYAAEKQLWAEFVAASVTDISGATSVTPRIALAKVEQALGCSTGTGGVIHASREVVTHLIADNLVTQSPLDPKKLETVLGTPVVAGHGYASDRIYGTGSVVLHLGPVMIYEGQNISINDLVNKAERPAELVWDDCCIVAATPTLS